MDFFMLLDICHKEGKVPSFVKTKSLQKAPSQQQVIAGQNLPKLCCFGEGPTDKMVVTSDHFFAMPPSLTINGRSIEAQLHEDTQRYNSLSNPTNILSNECRDKNAAIA